jgi:hypothetical protein
LSTNFDNQEESLADWISQAEAARLHGVSRQAISKLVGSGRLKTKTIGGRILVSRGEVESFSPQAAGRPRVDDLREVERIRRLLADARPEVRRTIFDELRKEYPIHALEAKLGVDAEVILGAIDRSGELTLRMIRGVIAEAAFEVYVMKKLENWQNETLSGNPAYDFELRDDVGSIRIQVKLQRSERGVPKLRKGLFVVETQRTRSGLDQATGQSTRPYRFGEFDILAVAMHPSKGRWDAFLYTVADWLTSRPGDEHLMEVLQPVALEPNDDWTDDFATCVGWLRSSEERKIRRSV